MPTLVVRAPDLDAPVTIDLPRGRAALIGRAPDPDEVAAEVPEGVVAAPFPVASPRRHLSKNHLLVWTRADGAIVMKDLRTANGTWLKLPAGAPVVVTEAPRLAVQVGSPAPPARSEVAPDDAEWAEPAGFAEAVRGAVAAWLEAIGVQGSVEAAPPEAAPTSVEVFPLADGSALGVTLPSDRTWSVELGGAFAVVRAYVARQNARYRAEEGHDEGFVLASRAIRGAHQEVVEAAQRGAGLVLIGETGAGKDDLARCYHTHSGRAAGPFVVIHCGNLVGDIGYVDLFGAVEGAAQGIRAKKGAVEDANGGTLFLDELAEMPPKYQAALLRFLNPVRDGEGRRKTGEFFRLGDVNRARPRYAEDVSVVCATSVDLDDPGERARHGFRSDLWNRLAQHVVHVPPLSARPEDVRAFLQVNPRDQAVKLAEALQPDALRVVLEHRWPGNYRALWNFARSPRLPRALAPGCLSAALCREVLRLDDAAPSGPRRGEVALTVALPDVDWDAVNAQASRAFAEDNGGPAATIGQLDDYLRLYLKPVLVAHAAGLREVTALSKDVNYSEIARRLHFKDGTSVRLQLARYVERFRR